MTMSDVLLSRCIGLANLSGFYRPLHNDVMKRNIFRVTGHLCGEFTGPRWIPLTKASDAERWCFLWSAPWINGWVNNREASDLRRHRAHHDIMAMVCGKSPSCCSAYFTGIQRRNTIQPSNLFYNPYMESTDLIKVFTFMLSLQMNVIISTMFARIVTVSVIYIQNSDWQIIFRVSKYLFALMGRVSSTRSLLILPSMLSTEQLSWTVTNKIHLQANGFAYKACCLFAHQN